jgi:hypothetical protein
MATKFIKSGNRAVIITTQNDSLVWASLYANVRNANSVGDIVTMGDIINLTWSGKTMKGAEKWAAKQLAESR